MICELGISAYQNLYLVIFLLPLASFALLFLLGKRANRIAAPFSTILIALSFLQVLLYLDAGLAWDNMHGPVPSVPWLSIGDFQLEISFRHDELAALMQSLVCLVSLLVHVFSASYMKEDPARYRYFAFLGLFTFNMLALVSFNNLLFIFIAWELVGLSSYLLIGFWWRRASASAAAKKAFLVNRIGDAGFLIGMLILYAQFGTLDLSELSMMYNETFIRAGRWVYEGAEFARSLPLIFISLAGMGLFCGAIGKSAQFPLQIWLPDAMEGPTPVSALIHAATMVAAGVYLMGRIFFLLDIPAMTLIAFIGALTTFMAAVVAMRQYDIKKVLAYSTISQLGYMIMGMGVGAWQASLFHLFTHAFFKATLFLGAGAIIHAMHDWAHEQGKDIDAQDMRHMGGLLRLMPKTALAFLLAAAALAGLPFTSGFLSKDAILSASLAWGNTQGGAHLIVPALAFFSVALTAWYVCRMVLLTFFGEFRGGEKQGLREVPLQMWLPVGILAAGSLFFLFSINPLDASEGWLQKELYPVYQARITGYAGMYTQTGLNGIRHLAHNLHLIVSIFAVLLSGMGILLAWRRFRPGNVQFYLRLPATKGLIAGLSAFNWYLDELYAAIVVRPVLRLASLSQRIDGKVIDRSLHLIAKSTVLVAWMTAWVDRWLVDGMVKGIAGLAAFTGTLTRKIQGGNIQGYFVWSVLFMTALILMMWTWMT